MSTEPAARAPLAIVGIGCRFPGGADTPEGFWDMMCGGIDATGIIPEARWNSAKYFDPNPAKNGKMITERGGFLNEVDQFDPQFFGISPREAHSLDPQQRLLLRATWEAFEDGGIRAEDLAGQQVGVFIGGFTTDYQLLQNHGRSSRYRFKPHSATGMMMTMLSNRISYTFDLRGPSMTVDTACSSSLVAVHLAAQSIWNGESEMALAGGVNVIIGPNTFVAESKSGFLSPDGRCKSFSRSANGYARGEGGAIVIIKPLEQALDDGDRIYAQILGSGVSQDGRTDGITVPSEEAQEAAITAAIGRAGVEPADIGYVEAHGTGTPVGDPIEARALAKALAGGNPRRRPLLIGSVKTNIGHLEAGAGIAGLIKAALVVKQAFIPPNLHLDALNDQISLGELNIDIPSVGRDWPTGDGERLAGINSFGFGGTNAHVVLAQPPENADAGAEEDRPSFPLAVLPISARADDAVADSAGQLAEYLRATPDITMADLGYTLGQRRSHLSYRRTLVVDGIDDARSQLAAIADGSDRKKPVNAGRSRSDTPKLAFVCTGMGAQWWKMCRGLLDVYPTFTASIMRSDRALQPYMGWSLIDELRAEESQSRMAEPNVAQSANFAIQVALAEQLREFGVVPDAVIGHSAGEVAAHYLAGILTFEQAIAVILQRSEAAQRVKGLGGMLAIGLSADSLMQTIDATTREEMGSRVSIAAINGPSAVVASGDRDILGTIAAQLTEVHIFNRFLNVDVPYHSHYMDPLRDDMLTALSDISSAPAQIPVYSTVTGELLNAEAANGAYWWQNTRWTVLFEPALRRMLDDGYTHFVELGPHPQMASAIVEIAAGRDSAVVVLASQKRNEDDSRTLMELVGDLHCHGHPIAWDAFYPKARARLLSLPRYPWQAKSYWNETPETVEELHYNPVHPILGQPVLDVHPTWEAELSLATLPFLADHKAQGSTLVPGTAFIEMAVAAGREAFGSTDFCVENLNLQHAVILDQTCDPTVRTTLDRATGVIEFAAMTATTGGDLHWVIAATAELNTISRGCRVGPAPKHPGDSAVIEFDEFYARSRAFGFEYGEAFQSVRRVTAGDGWATGELVVPESIHSDLDRYRFHPALIDGALQTLLAMSISGKDLGTEAFLPSGIRRATVHGSPQQTMTVEVRMVSVSKSMIESDITISSRTGELLVSLEGFTVASLNSSIGMSPEHVDKGLLDVRWVAGDELDESKSIAAKDLSWLVLSDSSGIGSLVARQLRESGQRVRTAVHRAVDRLVEVDGEYRIDGGQPQQFVDLIDAHVQIEGDLAGIVNCWPLDVPDAADSGTDGAAEEGRRVGVFAALHLAAAMARHETVCPRLYLVTANAQPVPGTDRLAVDQAPLWGLGRVIGHQELTDKWGGLIDIDDADDPAQTAERLCRHILTEGAEDQVAFRGTETFVPRLFPMDGLTKAFPTKLTPDATYVVTGGLGALGQVVARYLAKRGARDIVLFSRTELPPRSRWSEMSVDDAQYSVVDAIRGIEKLGAHITTARVDITDLEQVQRWARDHTRQGGRPVRGVIHAAGVVEDQLLVNMDEASFAKVLAPKIDGARVLSSVFHANDLEFFVMFGSAGSVIASPGQGNYAAANSFLDVFACQLRAKGLPALTIGWGPWSVGMVEELKLEKMYEMRGVELITPEAGGRILDRVMSQEVPTVVAISADWARLRKTGMAGQLPAIYAELGKADALSDDAGAGFSLLDVLKDTPEADQLGVVAGYVTQIVAGVFDLPLDDVGGDATMNDLGLDSMMAIELKSRIAAVIAVDVPVLELLKGITVSGLVDRIFAELQFDEDTGPVPVLDDRPETVADDHDVDRLIEQLSTADLLELLADLEAESPVQPK
ncbi:type I polyketide synthase [Rhodococcoides navarretei]|uniref:Type I polyketide synthase n=1 Tax=Rhodococcus navarretei TaxID=3128981 RepID=A0ABU9CQB5_9NOCA